MAYLKKYSIRVGFIFLEVILSLAIVSAFYYFGLVNDKVFNFLQLLIVIISVFINSFILGKDSSKNGYLEGVKLGGILLFIFMIVAIVCRMFKVRVLIYYFIIMVTSILGSMVGISRKKD